MKKKIINIEGNSNYDLAFEEALKNFQIALQAVNLAMQAVKVAKGDAGLQEADVRVRNKCIKSVKESVKLKEIELEMALRALEAVAEAKRLSEMYGKDYFDCDELVAVMGLDKHYVLKLMNASHFPTVIVDDRKVISVLAYAKWLYL